jgi:hypothetical protein
MVTIGKFCALLENYALFRVQFGYLILILCTVLGLSRETEPIGDRSINHLSIHLSIY